MHDKDPAIEELFARSRPVPVDEEFTRQVLARIDGLRRRALAGWLSVAFLMVVAASLLAGPVTHVAGIATGMLPESLVDIDDRVMAQLLAPVNSVAGAIGLAFLLLRAAYKSIFS